MSGITFKATHVPQTQTQVRAKATQANTPAAKPFATPKPPAQQHPVGTKFDKHA